LIVQKRFEVDLNAVEKSRKLKNQGCTGESKKWDPKVLEAFVVVDVTDIAKSEGDPRKTECHG